MHSKLYSLRWLLLLLISFVGFSCEEDTVEPEIFGAIQGEVVDARNNQPLANVSFTTTPGTSSFSTDAQGKFLIENIRVGTYSVVARKTDYRSETINISVTEGAVTSVRIVMELSSSSNVAPNTPFSPTPPDRATNQPVELTLKWRVSDPNGKSDSLRSEVVLFESNSPERRTLVGNTRDTTVVATGLKYNTTYFWQVTVRDKAGLVTRGDVWTFQTRTLPDNQFLYVQTLSGNTDIYSSDAMGGNLVRLTSSPFAEKTPRLSPQYDLVAYTSNASGMYRLYTMNRDGSNQKAITPANIPVEGYSNFGDGYCWSPDGSQLLFANYDNLWRINRDGTGLVRIAVAPAGRHFRECDWNVQNNRILVQTVGSNVYDSEIYLMDADGANKSLLIGNVPGRLDSPSFNLQGTRIMYTKDVAGYMDATGRQIDAQIFTQNLDGTGVVSVSVPSGVPGSGKQSGFNDVLPRFTGNGAKIVFVQVNNQNQSVPEVWQMDVDGRNRMRLFQNATQPESK